MRVAQVGNHTPDHSTESELRRAMRYGMGWDVTPIQEDDHDGWARLTASMADFDFVMWTRTASLAPPHAAQWRMLEAAEAAAVPTVAYHLDRWWGLRRENEIRREPFFRCKIVCTADGSDPAAWDAVGVAHRWLPPGVSEFECSPGTPRDEYRTAIAFVGSNDGGYHPEAQHRHELVAFLRREYPDRCRFWPERGQHAIRGAALRDLYSSCVLTVGDSCYLPGETPRAYSSDRLFEAPGRGACLLHPYVEEMTDGSLMTDGEHLLTWPIGDWAALRERIDWALAHPEECAKIGAQARTHVRGNHTYTHRLSALGVELGLP